MRKVLFFSFRGMQLGEGFFQNCGPRLLKWKSLSDFLLNPENLSNMNI